MKRTFTLLTALILVAGGIFAQEKSLKGTNKVAGSFSENRFELLNKKVDRNPFRGTNKFKDQKRSLKSAEAIKQRLDNFSGQEWDVFSGQWRPDFKGDLIYDVNFNVTEIQYYEWDGNINQWISDGNEEYSYNANGNMEQSQYTGIDEITNETVIYERNVYSYDGQGNLKQEISYDNVGNETNELVAVWKHDYTYDAGGKLIQEIGYSPDEITNQMEAYIKTDYTYNSNGLAILMIDSYMQENAWIQSRKYETTYNSIGNKTLYTYSDWDTFNNIWGDPLEKYEYSYNASGNLTQEYRYTKGSVGQWIAYSKDDYTFDANGNNTEHISYYGWDESTSKWNDVWKEEYTFNNDYSFEDLILPFGDLDLMFHHMLTEIKEYSWNIYTLTWILDYKSTYGYSEQNYTSVNQQGKEIVNVYPNPFAETVTVSLPASYFKITFDLFDQQGRMLMSKLISSNEKVSLQGFNKGIYFYRLNIDGKIQSGKLLKD